MTPLTFEDSSTTPAGAPNQIAVSNANPLPVALSGGGGGALAAQVQGNSASGVADVGNPVKVGAVYKTTAPTLADGQRSDAQVDSRGALRTMLMGPDSGSPIATANAATDSGNSLTQQRLGVDAAVRLFDGTNLARWRGDTTGAWVKTPLSAGTDRSITTSVASQTLMAANTLRYKLWIKNDSAVIQWINFGGTAVAAAGSGNMALAANSYYEFTGYNGAINIISGGAASAISAREFP